MRKLALAVVAALACTAALAQEAAPPPLPGPPPVAPPPPAYAPPAQAQPAPTYPPPGPAAPPAAHAWAPRRDSWYIGFGVGIGSGGYTLGSDHVAFKDHVGSADGIPLAMNFKVGGTLSPRLLLGFDLTGVGQQGTTNMAGGKVTSTIQVTNLDLMATFFPWETGLYLRGGGGLAALAYRDSAAGFLVGSGTRTGVGAVVGVGYAFWLGKSFNLTAGVDLSGQAYGSSADKPKSSSALAFLLGFDWY